MRTAAVMTREVVVVAPTVTLSAAAQMMQRLRIRHLPVIEGGRLVGILSDRDVLKYAGTGSAQLTCGQVMTPSPVTCGPETSAGHVAELMLEHKIDSVPVLGSTGLLVGLVTSADLLSLLVERDVAQVLPFDFRLRVAACDSDALRAA